VAGIVAFTAMGDGFKAGVNEYAQSTGADLLVMNDGVADPGFSRMSVEEIEQIRNHPGVEAIATACGLPARLPGRKSPVLVLGRDPSERLIGAYAGPRLTGELLKTPDEAMLGKLLADDLGLSVGDTFEMIDRNFTVSGIYETNVRFEMGSAILHIDVLREQLNIPDGSAQMLFVYLSADAPLQETMMSLAMAHSSRRWIPAAMFTESFDHFAMIDPFIWAISLAALIVGGIGILNTMLMSVSERTREIGMLRAFGWPRAMVLWLILREGLLTSFLGGLVGIGIGIAGAETLMRLIPQGMVSPLYSVQLFLIAVVTAVVVGFLGGLYPAWRASRLAPAEALRYE
jgi:putative ABC transport system permease protein